VVINIFQSINEWYISEPDVFSITGSRGYTKDTLIEGGLSRGTAKQKRYVATSVIPK